MQTKKRIVIAIFILTFVIINLIMARPVQAVTQITSTDIDNINETKYPGIKQMIKELQSSHPNWNFKVLYTNLDWNDVIANESVGHGDEPRNLVPVGSSFTGEWICEACGADKYYDNGSWRCASTKALGYMIDPRNSINSSDVFQFMELTYQECTYENIKPMVEGTFLNNDSYINAILTAGRNYNVSPYYIVALAIQEQGASGSSTVSGSYPGYENYYNIFNINASGNGSGTIITKALSYAKDKGWDTLEESIDGGVKKIVTSFIAKGQNTLYFQKFDVDNSDGQLYWHIYQQNIMAAQNEGVTIRKTFEKIDSIESAYTFIIPVYENMPQTKCAKPQKNIGIDVSNTEQVRLNVKKSINLRATPAGEVVAALYKDEIVYRLEKATDKHSGTYWDKVMKANGTIGYVARETYDYESEYKLYLIPLVTEEPETPSDENTELTTTSNEKIKVDTVSKQITIVPETTIQEIINLVGTSISVQDKDGNILGKTATPGTGSKVNGTYTVVMKGDINGDAQINTVDAARTLKASVGNYEFIDCYNRAADINGDGQINTIDAARLLKASVGNYKIQL